MNGTVPSILVKIIRSNYWVETKDGKKGAMRVDQDFTVKLQMADGFEMQYPVKSRTGANILPFVKKGAVLYQHTNKFQIQIS